MSTRGVPKAPPTTWIRLGCGHRVLYQPPVPQVNDELTCGVCGAATGVAA